jgi:hypothetical protein
MVSRVSREYRSDLDDAVFRILDSDIYFLGFAFPPQVNGKSGSTILRAHRGNEIENSGEFVNSTAVGNGGTLGCHMSR